MSRSTSHKNRIPVYLKGCAPEGKPAHHAAAWLAPLLLHNRIAIEVRNALCLITTESWASIKQRMKPCVTPGVIEIPALLPPLSFYILDFCYPEPYRSGALHPHHAFNQMRKEVGIEFGE